MNKILVIQIAGMGYDFLLKQNNGANISSLKFQPIKSIFPAVTCTVQASFRTGEFPVSHGIVGNGFYSRKLARPFFWEQSSSLIDGTKIWDNFRKSGKTIGQLFWQQSLGSDSDVLLSPSPIHKHHGSIIQDCYSRPSDLYDTLKSKLGRPFNLKHYWGPMVSLKSSKWITDATSEIMQTIAPDLLLTYLPHLDYELQKSMHDSVKVKRAFNELKLLLEKLVSVAKVSGYDVIAFSDYAITPVNQPIFPNTVLRETGYFTLRTIKGMTYPDFHSSKAFAIVDHQIAHIIVKHENDISSVKEVLGALPGVAKILDNESKKIFGINHNRSGELVLISKPNAWFAYPWWSNKCESPDYATHIDIHSKPGYDPCELFFGKWPFSISTKHSRIKGSHGIINNSTNTAWASTIQSDILPENIVDLSRFLKNTLNRRSNI